MDLKIVKQVERFSQLVSKLERTTCRVKDIYPGLVDPYEPYTSSPNSGLPDELTNVGGKLLFRASDGSGYHLWTSDGTSAGTAIADFLDARTLSGDVRPQVDLNGKLIFTAKDAEGPGVWISDGTPAGTQRLSDQRYAVDFANINGTVYFAGTTRDGRVVDTELWKTDGTAAGTVLVADIVDATSYRYDVGSDPSNFVGLNGKVIFRTGGYFGDSELWVTDGTSAGTALVRNIHPRGSCFPRN